MSDVVPTAMTLDQLADFLSRAGGKSVEPSDIQADVDAGAPKNPDGTINLLHYAAWLASR